MPLADGDGHPWGRCLRYATCLPPTHARMGFGREPASGCSLALSAARQLGSPWAMLRHAPCSWPLSRGLKAGIGGFIGALVGAGLGGAIGAAIGHHDEVHFTTEPR